MVGVRVGIKQEHHTNKYYGHFVKGVAAFANLTCDQLSKIGLNST
jgi:hypothetical protein